MVPIPAVIICKIREMVKTPLLLFGRGFLFIKKICHLKGEL
jgi:hypothetical protein